jgi:uncharacterized protein
VSLLEAVLVFLAAGVAGAVNAIVGSGSLVTFPVLVAVGYPSVTANVSNTVGLVTGNLSAAYGYRRELRGQWRRVAILCGGSAAGAVIGGILLLSLPTSVFDAVVPALILLACALMLLRPKPKGDVQGDRTAAATGGTFLTGIYGGYFGAAQGVILLALLRLTIADELQRLNGVKNMCAAVANGVAAVLFIAVAHVAWGAVALIAVGSTLGAQVGARYGRRLPDEILRRIVVVVGVVVAIVLWLT